MFPCRSVRTRSPPGSSPARQEGDRISAVQYIRFKLDDAAKKALAEPGTDLAVAIDHPNYQHRTELPEEARASLAADLVG